MKNHRRIDVYHEKYGWGYVFLIASDYLLVNFKTGSRIEFPIAAIDDGNLKTSGYSKALFRKMLQKRGKHGGKSQ